MFQLRRFDMTIRRGVRAGINRAVYVPVLGPTKKKQGFFKEKQALKEYLWSRK